jgi:uncharacterized protein (TIGR00369 family)
LALSLTHQKGGILGKAGKRELGKEHLEFAQSRMKLSKFSVLVGFEVEHLYEGGAILRMKVQDHHRQLHSVVHGGVIAALADTAAAIAAYTVSPPGIELVTIELKINYLLPIVEGSVEAEGKVLRAGRNFVVVECDVRNDEAELAAKALMTFGAAANRLPETQAGTHQKARTDRARANPKAGTTPLR